MFSKSKNYSLGVEMRLQVPLVQHCRRMETPLQMMQLKNKGILLIIDTNRLENELKN